MSPVAAQRQVFSLGLSPKHKGFHYLSRVLCMAAEGMRVEAACKAMESGGAREADRCMRYAIRYAWDGNEGRIRALFPFYTLPPTPVELIHALLWEVDEAPARTGAR